MDFPPPESLKIPLVVPLKTLLGPGPSNCPPRVLQALSLPILGHLHPECTKIMDEIKAGLQYVFQTKNALTLAVSASGHGGMEAILCNLLEPGEVAVIAVNGVWGQRACIMASGYGAKVVPLNGKLGDNYSLEELENAIVQYKANLLFITQAESSTGVYQPLEGLGAICHKYNCFLVVDAVASAGAIPLFTDRWGIDAVFSCTQKVLSGAPGLAPISFSPRAQYKIFNRKSPIMVFYWDMKILGDYWGCFGTARVYHHTISSTILCGLREALALVVEEGLEKRIARHTHCAKILHEGLKKLDVEFFVENENIRLPTITTIAIPKGIDWRTVMNYADKNYFMDIDGGIGPTANKIFRIGLLGNNATEENVNYVLRVFKEGLEFAKTHAKNKL